MYSVEDDAYYDFYVTSWTSGDGSGNGWGGDGNGALRLEGFLIIVQGPLTTNLQLQLKMFQMIKEAEYISILEGAR